MSLGVSYNPVPGFAGISSLDEPKANTEAQGSGSEELINEYREPTILAACREGKVEIVRRELAQDLGAVNSPYRSGVTGDMIPLLYIASQNGHADVVKLLMDNRAKIETPNKNGATPLFIASQEGHANVVKILVADGANPKSEWQMGFGATRSCLSAAKQGLSDSRNDQKAKYREVIATLQNAMGHD